MTSCYLLIKVVSAGYNNYKVNNLILYLFSTLVQNKFTKVLIK